MRNNILIASLFPTIDLIFLAETWGKDGISIAKFLVIVIFSLYEMDLAT